MSMQIVSDIEKSAGEKMTKTLSVLKSEMAAIRAGRANPKVLDHIMVEYYGTMTPINQVGNISVPEPRVIMISVWDASMLSQVSKAIQASDLGINPNNDGKVIRLVFPELNEERRRDLVKQIKKYGEDAKIAVRSIRRDAIEQLKKHKKDSTITEDELKKAEDSTQKLTDNYVKDIEKVLADKEKEIMEI